jgi:hypothetical protein
MLDAAVTRELALELVHFFAEDECGFLADAIERRKNFVA